MAKYQEVIDWIQKQVSSGALAPGDKIPSENDLCIQFNISRQTARHAIGILVQEGILTAERGSGTYVTDERARNGERSRIAVITTYVDSYIFPRTIQGIENKLRELGYSVQLFFTNNSSVREREILTEIVEKDEVAGIILEPTRSALPTPNTDLLTKISGMRIPILFMNSYYPEMSNKWNPDDTRKIPHVSMNDEKSAYKAVKSLLDNGHRNIGCVLKLDDRQGLDRYSGYQEAIAEKGLSPEASKIIWLDTEDLKRQDLVKDKIKERLSGCTAVFCYNDEMAALVMQILDESGIKVPEDISLISMDDSDLAKLTRPPIDSIPHPKEKLGERAAENLVRLIHHPGFSATYEFEEEISVRGSVRAIEQL
ncbi:MULTISPECIES: GntR family transcriptional regulator [unclassified Butyrivibrio]|uniref:GntR family transcriptional regulator n=1 Tax=unclassified Butyrivibrio TaxID=2639466 RepID=UPI0003F5A140|nr:MULTISPECIES: GntR family transcriptional regulator [unclassified Butyrivibrio]